MATVDISKLAAIVTSSPTPVLDALAVQFGVPTCLLDFSKAFLDMLPSSVLGGMFDGIQDGKDQADSLYKDLIRKIFIDTGILEYDTDKGKYVFVSKSSGLGVEENSIAGLEGLHGLGKILGFGAQAWLIGEGIVGDFNELKNCIDSWKSYDALQNGPAAMADKFVGFTGVDGEVYSPPPAMENASIIYEQNKSTLEKAVGFSDSCSKQMKVIGDIRKARAQDPANNPEPVFNGDLTNADGETLADLVGNKTPFTILTGLQQDPETGDWIIPPEYTGEGAPDGSVDVFNTSGIGAPVAKDGQFLFSRTGIYYDSYGGGLDWSGCITNIVSAVYYDPEGNPYPGNGVPTNAMRWLQEYNPNLGGKGQHISWNTFNQWAETVFDINQINETPELQQYYEADHFLQVLVGQRDREIYDTSSIIQDYQAKGYGEDSALLMNQRQILYSKINSHNLKIKRRKKQIEVHVVLSPDGSVPTPGKVPINDLRPLDSAKIAIQRALQERLMFQPDEVSGIILPLCPEYIKSEVPQDEFTLEEILVPEVGVGGIINTDKDLSLGTSGTLLSLNSHITTDNLVAIYNFLDADLVNPNSEKYKVINCSTSSALDGAAQLVASSVTSMFPSGIGLPYFRGMCNFFSGVDGDGNRKASRYSDNSEYLKSAYRPYGYGRIEGGWNDIDSLLYASGGATIETWVHMPDLGDTDSPGWNTSSELSALHRVVLGCENRGGTVSALDDWITGPHYGSESTRGLLLGFSRDRRITKGLSPSNNPDENDINSGLVFYMAPTQGVNTSGVTFMNSAKDIAYCEHDNEGPSGYYGLTLDTSTTVSGVQFNDVSSQFCLATITIDYESDMVNLYLNGNLMKSQSVHTTFGKTGYPNLPSLMSTSSFSYTNMYHESLPYNAPLFPPESLGQTDFWYWNGPQPGGQGAPPLTPWIIGGGYTDGMHMRDLTGYKPTEDTGMNFMGGQWGGKKSGLYGFLGSFKLYNRAITIAEITANYNGQRGFFENIKT